MNKFLLQALNAVVGILTVILASMGMLHGVGSPIYQGADLPALPALDSNLRFFGGMGLGLGLILLWITPSIERHTALFRAVWICAFLGGVGRAVSMVAVGQPPVPMLTFTAVEVLLAPVLIWWQHQVAKLATA